MKTLVCTLPTTVRSSRSSKAFTLIELLVVIAIIAILAGIAFPVLNKVQDRSRTVQAVSDMRSIKTAVASYYVDYAKYPTTSGQNYYGSGGDNGTTYSDTVFGDPNQGANYWGADLFNILRAQPDSHYGKGYESNPNQIVYWSGAFAKSATQPRSGITTRDVQKGNLTIHTGSLVDPWGNQYIVWFNVSKSGELTTALGWFYHDYPAVPDPNATSQNRVMCGAAPLGVECASMGPDNGFGTNGNQVLKNSDDIVTWQSPTY